VLERN